MTGTLVFEGPVEEFLERGKEFAGMRVSVFDTLETSDIDVATPNQTIRSKEHLEELLLSAQNSPMEPMGENYTANIMHEVRKRLAASEAAK